MTWQPPHPDQVPGYPDEDDPQVVLCGYQPTLPGMITLTALIICVWQFDGWQMIGAMFCTIWAGGMFNRWMIRQHMQANHKGMIVRRMTGRRG